MLPRVDDFHDRREELAALERFWASPGGRLGLVWGCRRTGKSFLLTRFAEEKRAIHFTATQRAPEAELRAFSDTCRAVLEPAPTDVLAGGAFRDWDEALRYLAASSGRGRLLVVLDEFSYLVDADPSLPSIIQRFWDREGRDSKLRLVLCGSASTVLERLGAERAPLFGRFDMLLQVHPFTYRDAAAFNPGLEPARQALVHGVLGGMPLYLRMWDQDASVERNLSRLFADPGSILVSEGELLLRMELPDAPGYFRLMAAIASGRTSYSKIRDAAGLDPTRGLERLTAMRLLERRTPVTERPERTRLRVYRIADNFLAFWFRFVYPNRGEIERGLGEEIVRSVILRGLDDHMGPVFEQMARDYVRLEAGARLPAATSIGSWWSGDGQTEIDVVALRGKEVVLAGEAKWSRTVDRRVLRALEERAVRIPGARGSPQLILFAREGFRDVARNEAITVTAAGLYD